MLLLLLLCFIIDLICCEYNLFDNIFIVIVLLLCVESEEDLSVNRMRNVLDSMLKSIQTRIDVTEKVLAPKVQLLDLDQDGVFSSAELKEAVRKILKRYPTDKEAEILVNLLDKDKDGIGEQLKTKQAFFVC